MSRKFLLQKRIMLDAHDTNLSWRFMVWFWNRVGLQWDWWYDRASRKRLWMPFEFTLYRRSGK